MDVVKLAFDTLIVGALALPWLAVLVRMYQPPPEKKGRAEDHLVPLAALPEHTKEAVAGVVILALGYFLGSAVSRISDDFFDDDELMHTRLPTEASIREDVYKHEYCTGPKKSQSQKLMTELIPDAGDLCTERRRSDDKRSDDKRSDAAMEFYRLQEAKLLLLGQDRTARLRELYSQTVILRGATFNGMILSTLCLFGFSVSFRRRPIALAQTPREVGLVNGVAVALIIYGVFSLVSHFNRINIQDQSFYYNDPPLAELTICLLGVTGLFARAGVESRWRYARACGLSFALTLIAYGAWWWTEVVYYETVIHAVQTVSPGTT